MKHNKTKKDIISHYLVLTLIVGTGLFTFVGLLFDHILFHQHILYASQNCVTVGKHYVIAIVHNKFSPAKVTVHRCDRLTFINDDPHTQYIPAFGDHPRHIQLPGFTEKTLDYKQTNSFIIQNTGTFSFHDHLKDILQGELFVK